MDGYYIMNSSEGSNGYHDNEYPLPDGGGGGDDVYTNAHSNNYYDANSNSHNNYTILDDDQYRTDILKLILYDLNSAIAPRESRLLAIRTALEEFDHDDELLHEEELDLRADHILLQKLTYALSIDPGSEEVGYICSALEAVYRANRERLAQSFHEICDDLLPLLTEMIRPPPSSTLRGGRGVVFSLRRQQEQQKQSSAGTTPDDELSLSEKMSPSNNDIPPGTGEYLEEMACRISSGEGINAHPPSMSASVEAQDQEMSSGAIVQARILSRRVENNLRLAAIQPQRILNSNTHSTEHISMEEYGQIVPVLPPETTSNQHTVASGEAKDTIRMDLEDAKQAMLNQISESLASSLAITKYEDDSAPMALRGGGIEEEEKVNELHNVGRECDNNFVNDNSELSNDDSSSVLLSEFNDLFCETRGSVASRLMYEDQDNPFSDTSSLYDTSTISSFARNGGGGYKHHLSATHEHDTYLETDGAVSSISGGGDGWRGATGGNYNEHDVPKINEYNEDGAEDVADNNRHDKTYYSENACNSESLPTFSAHVRHEDNVNSTSGENLSQSSRSYMESSSGSGFYSGIESHDLQAHEYEQSDHPNNDYMREHSTPFGYSDDLDGLRRAKDTYSEPAEYPNHQPSGSTQYTSTELEIQNDRLHYDEGKISVEEESSNLHSDDRIPYDEDILQFQKSNLFTTSRLNYSNYFDQVTIEVCPIAIRKVLKILRYFSRVLSAMEPMAQQFGLVDTLLYHMMKKPLSHDHDSETASRIDAIAVMVNLACAEENKHMLVYHPVFLDVVINIANCDPIDEAREHATIVMMNLVGGRLLFFIFDSFITHSMSLQQLTPHHRLTPKRTKYVVNVIFFIRMQHCSRFNHVDIRLPRFTWCIRIISSILLSLCYQMFLHIRDDTPQQHCLRWPARMPTLQSWRSIVTVEF